VEGGIRQHGFCLFEELLVSGCLAYSDVAVFPAEVQDLVQERVVALLKLSLETDSSRLHTNLEHSVAGEKLVETELFSSVFFEDVPVLYYVYQS